MQRWEYFTTTLASSAEENPVPVRDEIAPGSHGKYSPYALIPQLNELGEVGKKGDVVRPDANAYRWGRDYFCCFKRPIPED